MPNSISPSTWIPGFSDAYNGPKDFMCAIAGPEEDAIKAMGDQCCKGEVHNDDAGCYHWCTPYADDITDWATCISDHVYTDINHGFGQSCNAPGTLQLKNEKAEKEDADAEAEEANAGSNKKRSSAAPQAGLNAWKVGLLVGFVGLVQVIC